MGNLVRNFGRNVAFTPRHRYRPESVDELLQIMREHPGKRFRAIGSLHSWSEAAVTSDVLIDVSRFDSVDVKGDATAVVGSGCKVKRLLQQLAERGLTLPSIGLIDEQTLAGATATGTHGSGRHSLSHYVQAVTLAHFDESGAASMTRIEGGDALRAARCSLGLMGIVVSLEMVCRPQYRVLEYAQRHDSLSSLMAAEAQTPLQQFYLMPWSWQWFCHHRVESEQARSRLAAVYRWYNYLFIDIGLHVIIFTVAKWLRWRSLVCGFYRYLLPWTLIRGWRVVDDSHAMLIMEHELFRHIEIEVFVQREQLQPAIDFLVAVIKVFGSRRHELPSETSSPLAGTGWLEQLRGKQGVYQHHYPICVRRVLSDDTLLSMATPSAAEGDATNSDWYAISLISYDRPCNRQGFFEFADFVGPAMARLFGGRCHWGKYNSLQAEDNRQLYPRIDQFCEIVNQFDPDGRFRNRWLTECLGLDQPADVRTTSG